MRVLPLETGIVYGPIRSRRLGLSLGINLLPTSYKLCSFDCVYCHYGRTRRLGLDMGWLGAELPTAAQVVRDLERALPAAGQRDLHEIFTRSAGEILDDWFESEPIKALYGFDAVVGNYAGPYAPGSAYVLLHHAFGEVNGRRGVWGHAVGGMGAITQAMAAEARRRGVTLLTEAQVSRVLVRDGRARGVVLAETIKAAESVIDAFQELGADFLVQVGKLDRHQSVGTPGLFLGRTELQ